MCLAIPGKIVELVPDNHSIAVVDVMGVRRHVDLGLLEGEPIGLGDWVLIHVGFAMSKVSEQDALEQMNTLAMLGEAEAAMQEVRGYGLAENDKDQSSQGTPVSAAGTPASESNSESLPNNSAATRAGIN